MVTWRSSIVIRIKYLLFWAAWSVVCGVASAEEPKLGNASGYSSHDGARAKLARLIGVWGGLQLKADASVLAFSSARNLAATGGNLTPFRVWDLNTGRQIRSPVHEGVTCAAFSRDGKILATGNQDGVLVLFDTSSGHPLHTFRRHQGEVSVVAFSSNGKYLASGGEDGTVRLWDLARGRGLLFAGHVDWIRALAFFPDGKRLASASDDGTIRIWNTSSGRSLKVIGKVGGMEITAFAVSPDGHSALVDQDGPGARLINLDTGETTKTLEKGPRVIAAIFSRDNARLTLVSTTRRDLLPVGVKWGGRQEMRISQWDVNSGAMLSSVGKFDEGSPAAVFSNDATKVVTSDHGGVVLWDLVSGSVLMSTHGHARQINAVAIAANRQLALTAARDGTARLWDARKGRELFTFGGFGPDVRAVALSPDGTSALVADANGLQKLWDMVTFIDFQTLGAHKDLKVVAFADEGRRTVSVSLERMVQWEVATGRELASTWFPRVASAVAVSADGSRVLSADLTDGPVVRDAGSGTVLQTLKGEKRETLALALSSDGSQAALAMGPAAPGAHDRLELWDAANGRLIRSVKAPTNLVSLTFSGDKHWLVGLNKDGSVYLFRLPGLKEAERINLRLDLSSSDVAETPTAAAFGQEGFLLVGTSTGGLQYYEYEDEPVR